MQAYECMYMYNTMYTHMYKRSVGFLFQLQGVSCAQMHLHANQKQLMLSSHIPNPNFT